MTAIAFHIGVGGNYTGIGRHMQELDAAGIPFGLVSIGNYGPIHEAVLLMRASNVPHVLVYRVTDLDVANYDLDPATAALNHYEAVVAELPPEFDKQLVWLCPINEPNKGRADWLGHFATAFAALAMGDGYKVTMFGWSSGEPEPEHWQLPGMRRYLELCAINPDKAAVALHEYSYTLEDIRHEYPYKIGRFMFLFDACEQMGIAFPTVHITEWGWTHEEVPEPTQALVDIEWAYRLYAPHPQIKMVAIWYLGSEFAGIANLCQRLIEPVTGFMLNAPAVSPIPPTIPPIVPPPAPPPAPPPSIVQKVVIQSTAGRGNVRTLPETTAATLIGSVPNGTLFEVVEDVPNWYGVKVYVSKIVAKLVEDVPPVEPPPAVFRFSHWPTNDKRINQAFGANPERYKQFNLPGHEGLDIAAAHDSPIYAVAAGTVAAVGDDRKPKLQGGHNYGVRVYIDHAGGYQSIYAHLNSRLVNAGDVVAAGQQIGKANNTGNSFGDHLHITLKLKGATAAGLTNYPLDIIDPTPFLAPLMGTPPAPGGELIDLNRFKVADPDCWRVVRMPDGRQEDVQDMELGNGLFVRRKGGNGEWHRRDSNFFYLVHDTSPDVGSEGVDRVYTLYKNGTPGAPKSKVQQRVGEVWVESGAHQVQFRAKENCQTLSENSGNATNTSVVVKHERNVTFNKFGQNLTFEEVVWERTGVETQIYGRINGKSAGWIGWSAPWGESEPVEIHWNRGRLTEEPNRWCDWI